MYSDILVVDTLAGIWGDEVKNYGDEGLRNGWATEIMAKLEIDSWHVCPKRYGWSLCQHYSAWTPQTGKNTPACKE
jgi:hypothetical protein